jgi:hypothetical protein
MIDTPINSSSGWWNTPPAMVNTLNGIGVKAAAKSTHTPHASYHCATTANLSGVKPGT